MASSTPSPDRFVLVICPGCNEPLYPRREHAGKKVRCPACGYHVPVPREPQDPVKPPPAAKTKPQKVDEYGIHGDDYVPQAVEYIRVACPTCGTLIYAEPELEGRQTQCPDCHTQVRVRRSRKHEAAPRRPEDIGQYQVLEDGSQTRISEDDYFLLVCPQCNARLHPSRKLVGKRVRCPDCKEPVLVPAAPPRKEKKPAAVIDAYGLETETSQRLGPEHYFAYTCPHCSARLKSLRERAGEKLDCPDCGERITVPQAPELRVKKALAKPIEHEVSSEVVSSQPMREPVQPDAIEHRIRLAARPRWTFFTNVFNVPWRGEALSRWALTSLGLFAAGTMAVAGLLVSGVAGGGMNLMAGFSLAFFGMVVLWLSLWTFSYAACCMLAIIQDTSAGGDEVVAWPEADWREWIWGLLHVGFQVAVSLAVGYGLSRLASIWLADVGLIWLAGTFLVFPVLLLSSLETDSAFMPLSAPIFTSLVTRTWCWLVVFALSAVLLAATCGLVWSLAHVSLFLVPLAGGPVVAALLFIYARLLGRLAWRITT